MDALRKFKDETTEHTNHSWQPSVLGGQWLIRLYPHKWAEQMAEKYTLEELTTKRDECFPHAFAWRLYNTAMRLKG